VTALGFDAQVLGAAARTAALRIPGLVIDAPPAGRRPGALERMTRALEGRLVRVAEPLPEAIAAAARAAAALAARDGRWWPPRSPRGSR